RSGVFFYDKAAHNQLLAERCFQIMQAQLRFNICSIKPSFTPDDEILELEERITTNISEELFYSCRFWIDHSMRTDPVNTLLPLVHGFLSQQLLFWMEVMNLKKCITTGTTVLSKLNTWLSQPQLNSSPDITELASGSSRFLIRYITSPISAYTPHIYLSALPLSPASNALRSCYLPRYKGLVRVSGTLLEKLEGSELCTWKPNFEICSAALWPDGDIIVLGSYFGEISMHNVYNGRCVVKPYNAPERPVYRLQVSNNGTQVVSGSGRILHVWSMQDGSLVSGPFKGHTAGVISVSYSPNDAQIVSGSRDHTIGIWNAHDAAAPMRSLTGHTGPVNSVAFSPDGKCIASGSGDHTVHLWDLSTGTIIRILQHHRLDVRFVQFSPDGVHVISGSLDSGTSICILNVDDGSLCGQPIRSHSLTSIAISPEGHIASVDMENKVCVWNKYTSEMIAGPFLGHTCFVPYVGFSGDGMCIISASTDNTVRVWNAHGRLEQVKRLSNVTTKTPDDHLNFTVSRNQTQVATFFKTHSYSNIDVWDPHSGALQTSISAGPSIEFVRFSLDGTRIISVHKPCVICVWDIHTAELIGGPHTCFASEDLQLIACSADATRIVAWDGNSDKFELWDAQSHQLITYCKTGIKRDIKNSTYSFRSSTPRAMFSLDGRRFATRFSDDNDIHVWDADGGLCIAGPFPTKKLLDISPDGTTILCLNSANTRRNRDRLQLINVDNGDTTLVPGTSDMDKWSNTIFSPDGRYVVNNSSTGLHVFNIFDNTHTTIQPAWFDKLEFFTCSHDGRCLARGRSNSGNVFHVWRFHIDRPFCATIRNDGWVLNGESQPLFWVPAEIREGFPRGTGDALRNDGGLHVDYTDMLVGEDWSKCYIGD
ncbi:POC1 centriolar protein A, partial [Ceratobasidium sp. 423]